MMSSTSSSASNDDASRSPGDDVDSVQDASVERVTVSRVNGERVNAERIAVERIEIDSESVEHVVAVRADADDPVSQIGQRAVSVMGIGTKVFFKTIKRMFLLGLVFAIAAAWYAENGYAQSHNVLRGIAAFVMVFLLSAGAGVMLAGQRAVAAVSLETWRQTGLVMYMLNLLLDKVGGILGAEKENAPPPAVELPLSDARKRLRSAVADWEGESGERSNMPGVLKTAQRWLAQLAEQVLVAEFRTQAGANGGTIRLPTVRESLAGRADDLIAVRVRSRMFRSTAGTIAGLVVLAVAVTYAISRMG